MALCVPKVMILGHSFVRRFHCDLEKHFDARAKRDFDLSTVNVRLFGTGGRTVAKINHFDLKTVARFSPDVVILEVGTNDLSDKPPETVGSEIDDLAVKLINEFSVRVVGICNVIPRADQNFSEKAELLNRYLSVVVDNPRVFTWRHKGLNSPKHSVLSVDGVHLNPYGQYLLYRSYRGAVLKALKILNQLE